MQPLDKIGMGARIKQIRKKAGLRQWQLAEQLGTTQSAVHKYEHGVIPEPRRLVELSRIGQTTIEWILTGYHWGEGSERQERPSVGVYRLAERFEAFGTDERRTLDEALRIVEDAVGAMRRFRPQEQGDVDLADRQKGILAVASRIHRAVLESVLDLTRERLQSSIPPRDSQPDTDR